MSLAPQRRLTLLDVMVLIAATAIGAQSVRTVWYGLNVSHFASSLDNRPFLFVLVRGPHAIGAVVPLVAIWTLTLTGLWMVQPRPSLRRLVLQPGFAACFVAALAIGLSALRDLAGWAATLVSSGQPINFGDSGPWSFACFTLIGEPRSVGIAVAVVWAWLILGKRWRTRATWIDRLGRVLGVYWLMMIFWNILLESLMISGVLNIA